MLSKHSLLLVLVAFMLLLAGCQQAGGAAPPSGVLASPLPPEGPAPSDEAEPDQAQSADSPTAEPKPAIASTLAKNEHGYARITVPQLVALRESADLFLLQVHFVHEWEIPDTDLFIALDDLPARLDELPPKDSLIVIYCRSGNWTQPAARFLAEQGYTNVADLVGGYSAWYAAGHPLLDRR